MRTRIERAIEIAFFAACAIYALKCCQLYQQADVRAAGYVIMGFAMGVPIAAMWLFFKGMRRDLA